MLERTSDEWADARPPDTIDFLGECIDCGQDVHSNESNYVFRSREVLCEKCSGFVWNEYSEE